MLSAALLSCSSANGGAKTDGARAGAFRRLNFEQTATPSGPSVAQVKLVLESTNITLYTAQSDDKSLCFAVDMFTEGIGMTATPPELRCYEPPTQAAVATIYEGQPVSKFGSSGYLFGSLGQGAKSISVPGDDSANQNLTSNGPYFVVPLSTPDLPHQVEVTLDSGATVTCPLDTEFGIVGSTYCVDATM